MNVKSYQDLEVWQKSMALVTRIYKLTSTFPKDELYGLSSQLRRAAISVPSNIAEGNSRRTTKDFMLFLDIAYASVAEVETQIYIARNLGYTTEKQISSILDGYSEIGKMLNGLFASLEKKLSTVP